MSERIQRQRTAASPHVDDTELTHASSETDGLDALLDEIDEVLSVDADAYVKSFVQKGGQ